MSDSKKPKEERSSKGAPMHFSVGAAIKNGEKYLLIDRAIPPWGFAGPAGHVDEGESETESLGRVKRDIRETKSIGWYTPDEIKKLELEAVWKYWFEKLGVLS